MLTANCGDAPYVCYCLFVVTGRPDLLCSLKEMISSSGHARHAEGKLTLERTRPCANGLHTVIVARCNWRTSCHDQNFDLQLKRKL